MANSWSWRSYRNDRGQDERVFGKFIPISLYDGILFPADHILGTVRVVDNMCQY